MFCKRNSHQILQYRLVGVSGQKQIYLENINQKKAGLTILISDKVDFREDKII